VQTYRGEPSAQRSATVDELPSTAAAVNVPSTVIEFEAAATTLNAPKTAAVQHVADVAVPRDDRSLTANSKRSSAARWSDGVFVSIDNNNCGDNPKQPKIDLDDVTDALDDVINVGGGPLVDMHSGNAVRNGDARDVAEGSQEDDTVMMVTNSNDDGDDALADGAGKRRNDRRRKMFDAGVEHAKPDAETDATTEGICLHPDVADASIRLPPTTSNGNAFVCCVLYSFGSVFPLFSPAAEIENVQQMQCSLTAKIKTSSFSVGICHLQKCKVSCGL
jgi:hypothetical protein